MSTQAISCAIGLCSVLCVGPKDAAKAKVLAGHQGHHGKQKPNSCVLGAEGPEEATVLDVWPVSPHSFYASFLPEGYCKPSSPLAVLENSVPVQDPA